MSLNAPVTHSLQFSLVAVAHWEFDAELPQRGGNLQQCHAVVTITYIYIPGIVYEVVTVY